MDMAISIVPSNSIEKKKTNKKTGCVWDHDNIFGIQWKI